jgi:glucose/arabinose dehydrogenase
MKKNLHLLLLFGCFHFGLKAQYYYEDRWPGLNFSFPVGMHAAPDSSKRIFVVEQRGRIRVFTDTGTVTSADTSTFLDVRSKLPNISAGNEFGLLGMAFHPNFKQNGFVFINYCQTAPLRTVVSRFKVDSMNPNRVNPNSEKIIMTVTQPFGNHNAGSLLFGKDGYLYLTMGDGGNGGDPGNRAQNRTNLLGKILRINVDVPENGPPYTIPADNPFIGNPNGWKEEMYALGVRNPWQMTMDSQTGTIWFGDVGQGAREEIDTLRKAANYGWKVTEGFIAYSPCGTCDTSNYEKPIVDYPRSLGISVTGGFVYRGKELYKLVGSYFYGDYATSRVWTLTKNPAIGQYVNTAFVNTPGNLSAFGLDYEGELYTVRYGSNNGKLFKIRCAPPTPSLSSPIINSVCFGDSIVVQAPNSPNVSSFKWSTGDTTNKVVIKTPGVYNLTLQVANSFGCWSNPSQAIRLRVREQVNQPQVANLSGCQGDTVELELGTGLIFNWSSQGSQNIFRTSNPGNFWVFASDSSSCKSDTAFFQVSFNSLPPTPVLVLLGDSIKSNLSSGFQFEWWKDGQPIDTTISPFFIPNQAGLYSLVAINTNGCRSLVSNAILVTSTKNLARHLKGISLLPNPVGNELEIRLNRNQGGEKAHLQIYDLKGNVLISSQKDFASGESTWIVPSQNLIPGQYFIEIKLGKKRFRERFLKD